MKNKKKKSREMEVFITLSDDTRYFHNLVSITLSNYTPTTIINTDIVYQS